MAALDKVFAQHPGLNPNQPGNKGVTFLFWAYAHHSVPLLQALVRHGASVNQVLHLPHERPQNQGGPWLENTHLLNIATEGPQDDLLVALLDLGADPSVKDYRDIPAVQNAIYINKYERMKLLLDRGADIDGTDSAGATAASLLANPNYFELVYYLLERGADWRAEDGSIAFHVQESEVGSEDSIRWQIKVKHWLMAHGVKFPVPTGGAKRYQAITDRWERTPEGHAWRVKLDALGSQPDVVGERWVQQETEEFAAMQAWMEREGIAAPPL
ncbi:hypothetical protein GCM10027422_26850 [Hymenobacter arcticus]